MFWVNLKVVPPFETKEPMKYVGKTNQEEVQLRDNLKAIFRVEYDPSSQFGRFSIWKSDHDQPELDYHWRNRVLEFKYQVVENRVLLYVRLDVSQPPIESEKEYYYEISFMVVPELTSN
jgi:hypothetical protein